MCQLRVRRFLDPYSLTCDERNADDAARPRSFLFSLQVLLLKINATKSCAGVSLKTQELYLLVFVTRYLDLLYSFISLYNTVMKLIFLGTAFTIVWYMRFHRVVSQTYNKDQVRGDFMLSHSSQAAIAEFGVERISGDQRKILATALRTVESRLYRGVGVATVVGHCKAAEASKLRNAIGKRCAMGCCVASTPSALNNS